jgi:4a-hydroxytetrahydrobiopterin dehydratase
MKKTMPGGQGLAERHCKPCKGNMSPMKGEDLTRYRKELGEGWNVIGEHHLEKEFKRKDWREAVSLTNKIAELADQEDHHPDVVLSYGKVKVTLWTHKIDGLSENDFILAAKIDNAIDNG